MITISKGMKVLILQNIDKTKRVHGLDSRGKMLNMRGNIYQVDRLNSSESITVNGCYWHPDDLLPFIEEKDKEKLKREPILFDIKNLNI